MFVGRVPFPTDGPQLHARAGGVPGRGARLARGERPVGAAAELRHRGRLRPPPRVGAHAVRTAAGRRCRGRWSTAAAAPTTCNGSSSRRSTTAPARRAASTRTASSSSVPTIMEVGTDEQKARFLPTMASARSVWAQAWSEPNAGSDLAAIRATGVLSDDGTEWVLNGQKIWAPRRCGPTGASASSAPTRRRSATGPHLHPRPARLARA